MNVLLSIISFWLMICLIFSPRRSLAQSSPPSPTPRSSVSAQEKRGERLFLQRCALCHLPKVVKPKTLPSFGPSLSGLFKNAEPDREKSVRETILKGSPNMPGFQYGLEPKDIDDLIAYLK